jgi:hypothetical protein
MQSPCPQPNPWIWSLMMCAVLTACGGGGSDANAAPSSVDTSSADSATATMAPAEAASAMDATMQTTQALVATSDSGSNISCPGGGTASYTLSSGTDNGQFETSEVYALSFDHCKGAAQAVAVTGSATLTVTSVTASSLSGMLVFNNLSAALPLSTLSLQGTASLGSALVYTRSQSGPAVTSSTTVSATSLGVSRVTASRSTSYTVNTLSMTRNTQMSGDGTVTASGLTGTATLSTTRASGTYSATLAVQSSVDFVAGVPTSGQWAITLPSSLLTVNASAGSVTVAQDLGKDGTIDRTHTFTPGTWAGSAD